MPVETPRESVTPTNAISPSFTPTRTPTMLPTQTQSSVPVSTFTPIPLVRPEQDNISGTYQLKRSDGGECVIKVIFEPTSPIDKIGFELFCIRGAPSYNSGRALANVLLAHNMAVYSPNTTCSIVLEFLDDEIAVTQIGLDSDCGFGHTVYADGTYQLIDNKPPVLGCMRLDNPCNLPVPIP